MGKSSKHKQTKEAVVGGKFKKYQNTVFVTFCIFQGLCAK